MINREVLFGIKAKRNIVIQANIGEYNKCDSEFEIYTNYFYYGVGLKYSYLFIENPILKRYIIEPTLKVNYAINFSTDQNFYFYNIGINMLLKELPYFHINTGFTHTIDTNHLLGAYIGIGINF